MVTRFVFERLICRIALKQAEAIIDHFIKPTSV